MMSVNFYGLTGTIEANDEEFAIEFDAMECEIGNDGIGSYECHGRRGFDRGQDFIEDFTARNLKIKSAEGNEVTDPILIAKIVESCERRGALAKIVNEAYREGSERE